MRRGLTLIELMVTMAILAVLAALAGPPLYSYIAKKRVQGVVDEMLTDLKYARSLQLSNPQRIGVRFFSNSTLTCYVVFEFSAFSSCDCRNTDTPVCTAVGTAVAKEYKTVRLLRSSGITALPSSGTPSQVVLDSATGLPISGRSFDITVNSTSGGTVHVRTNAAGRASACSSSGHQAIYGSC